MEQVDKVYFGLQKCLKARGYLVVGAANPFLKPEDRVTVNIVRGQNESQHVVIMSKTNKQDLIEQSLIGGFRHDFTSGENLTYYRVKPISPSTSVVI